ncbi:MAG: BA14K family protein [Stappiaceae bacterium]
MSVKMLCKSTAAVAIVFSGAVMASSQASAQHDPRCDSYARDYANRSVNGAGNVVGGALVGAIGGAVIGGIVNGNQGAGAGAAIGAGAGGLAGAGNASRHWNQVYRRAYNDCARQQPRGSRASYGAVEPWSQQWYDYCFAKYRSFNPDTGYYTTYSGRQRFCQVR